MFRRAILIFLTYVSCFIDMGAVRASNSPAISLLEAHQIGLGEARKWDTQAELIYITSVGDKGSMPPSTLGHDGKREIWNLLFTNGPRNQTLIINIKKGKIAIEQIAKENTQDFKIIPQGDLLLDSTDMVQTAIKYGIRPGEGWAEGYHFKISKDQHALFFGVIGQNKDGKMTKLYMDKAGKVLGSETKK
ncbi:hypothetical protein [Paenibacillus sp. R14(2021)]|uniref:hypothetical protein n=1 Tax=Paenibacillus sp. R14(2021) TaxID=2859228 RepID=UPI001C612395|nr:hypothetical protein [Paenibacillus sp. R14(2021)]